MPADPTLAQSTAVVHTAAIIPLEPQIASSLRQSLSGAALFTTGEIPLLHITDESGTGTVRPAFGLAIPPPMRSAMHSV